MREEVLIRIHGGPELPTLIYLPGLHGDWLLVTRFREAVAGQVRFVEFTYPNTTTWTLNDFADAVAEKLRQHNVANGWLLAESFGSQVAWPLLTRAAGFRTDGLILAGGFGRHPWPRAVRCAEWFCARAPLASLTTIINAYAIFARVRFKQAPTVMANVREFKTRWGEELRQAAVHRLGLIARNDPGELARQATLPVYHLTGVLDPIVPWWPAQRWLRRECPGWRAHRIVWTADHNVLSTGTRAARAQVLAWLAQPSNRPHLV